MTEGQELEPVLPPLTRTQQRAVEEITLAHHYKRHQMKEMGGAIAENEELDTETREYAVKVGTYIEAVGIEPEGELFSHFIRSTYLDRDKFSPELAFCDAFFKGMRDEGMQGEYLQEDGIALPQGKAEYFFKKTLTNLETKKTLILLGNVNRGYRALKPGEAESNLGFTPSNDSVFRTRQRLQEPQV